MESQLFHCEYAELAPNGVTAFADCTLKQPIGPFPKGYFFSAILIDSTHHTIELYSELDDEKPVLVGNLKLIVEEAKW